MKLFNRKPKHQHNWVCVRITHYEATEGRISHIGNYTFASVRCTECGKVDEWQYRGQWTIEDINRT